jgi:alpha/beta superfamily hydrolase
MSGEREALAYGLVHYSKNMTMLMITFSFVSSVAVNVLVVSSEDALNLSPLYACRASEVSTQFEIDLVVN